jgi:hypothetical protein
MGRPLIIGFSGKKRVGKDAAADAVKSYGFVEDAMASPIKTISREVFRLSYEQLYGAKKEVEDEFWGLSPREIMQKVGTDFARSAFNEEVWVDSFRRRMQDTDHSRIVITDVRFPNEVEAIHDLGGQVIRICRPRKEPDLNSTIKALVGQFPRLSQYFGTQYHPSETALDNYEDFDLRLLNDGTLAEYRYAVKSITKIILRLHGRDHSHSHTSIGRLPGVETGEIRCSEYGRQVERSA